MKVWIDQDLCTGDGLCAEICPEVFVMLPDGLAYVQEHSTEPPKIFAASKGNPEGSDGQAIVPINKMELVKEAAEECPGECIFISL